MADNTESDRPYLLSATTTAATERWFIRRGVPHFIHRYNAREDIFTRAAPLLTFIFLLEILNAANFRSWWANVLAVAAAFILVVLAWGQINRARGRPRYALPRTVGNVELAVFVVVPALVPLIFGGDVGAAGYLVLGNAVLLVMIYLGTSYGVVPITTWATRRTGRQLAGTLSLFARALPLLLLAITFLFINAEVWQVSARLFGPLFVATLALFAGFGALFAIVRLPKEIGQLGRFTSWDRVHTLIANSPVADIELPDATPDPPPLERTEMVNVGLVLLLAQGVQVLLVVALVFGFLVTLGLLIAPPDIIADWVKATPHVLAELDIFGRNLALTEELLRVAAFLAAFSGLYFAVTAPTDANYREEFFSEVIDDVREGLAVRCVYRAETDAT
jgi:hypothetical protein